MKFFIVDAFADRLFGGNGAGVVLLDEGADFPPDAVCVKTAAELRYSETAFVRRLGPAEFSLRYFTPAAEVELCGHATIGAFAALRHAGLIGDGTYLSQTRSGTLNVDVRGGEVLMDMAAPVSLGTISEEGQLAGLYRVMGLDYAAQREQGLSLLPQIISTGLPDIMLPVVSFEALQAIAPDFPALSALSARYDVVGVHAFAPPCGNGKKFHVRNFAPRYAIDEEAATGTSNGALTWYGYLNGFLAFGDRCEFIQGEKMGRPSVILSGIEKTAEGCRIRVGGGGLVLVEGNIMLF